MRRIGLAVVLALGLALSPLTGEAQQARGKAPLIGLLDFGAPDPARVNWWTAFRNALQELGYSEALQLLQPQKWGQGCVVGARGGSVAPCGDGFHVSSGLYRRITEAMAVVRGPRSFSQTTPSFSALPIFDCGL